MASAAARLLGSGGTFATRAPRTRWCRFTQGLLGYIGGGGRSMTRRRRQFVRAVDRSKGKSAGR